MPSLRQQVPLFLELSFCLALCTANTLSGASPTQCADVDDGLSAFAQQLSNLSYAPIHHSHDRSIYGHNLRTQCPPMEQGRSRALGLHHVSLCPWIYVEDYDYDRFPHQMVYARCTCGRCSTPSGLHHQCRPLHQSFHVIRRVCEGGEYRYRFVHESLPIACICSYRETHIVD